MSQIDPKFITDMAQAFYTEERQGVTKYFIRDTAPEHVKDFLHTFIERNMPICGGMDGTYMMTYLAVREVENVTDGDYECADADIEAPYAYHELYEWFGETDAWSDVDNAMREHRGSDLTLCDYMQIAYVNMLREMVELLVAELEESEAAHVPLPEPNVLAKMMLSVGLNLPGLDHATIRIGKKWSYIRLRQDSDDWVLIKVRYNVNGGITQAIFETEYATYEHTLGDDVDMKKNSAAFNAGIIDHSSYHLDIVAIALQAMRKYAMGYFGHYDEARDDYLICYIFASMAGTLTKSE